MELRFPLDMGILIITCPNCKTSFRMDPDDPKTYVSGSFDLSSPRKQFPFHFPLFDRIISYIYSTKDIRFLIPIFLFFVLLLNLLKIFNTATQEEQKENLEKERQEFFQEMEPEKRNPENRPDETKPSVEI